jgi:uncharacterized glyoxalase superfamily metalloenzyme YdcJ
VTVAPCVSADVIRTAFSAAISDMYKFEVPQYRTLTELVADVNNEALAENPELEKRLRETGELDRLSVERHGAIRVGTAEELSTIRRLFAVMGMEPVGYYDLSVAGIPAHSTAFRPTADESLRQNPFRVFASLLRLDLIEDAEVRREAAAILARRNIFTPRCKDLLDIFEEKHELNEAEAREFVSEAIETFRWRGVATVSAEVYHKVYKAHPLIADIVCFKGPHINHLALATLDIDAVQRAMVNRNMNPKAIVEGPPRRRCDILLRQTSFKAIQEPISFEAADGTLKGGAHAARFGEIEQRGIALTAKGRALYDRLLASVLASTPIASDGSNAAAHAEQLRQRFKAFPDDYATLRAEELAFFRYSPTAKGLAQVSGTTPPLSIEELVQGGLIRAEPITYEDFLPASAAGIFRSNLNEDERRIFVERANQKAFEDALGAAVVDELTLYAETEAGSRIAALKALGFDNEARRQGFSH